MISSEAETQHDRAEATGTDTEAETEGETPVRSRKTIINVTTPQSGR
nr:hypothetical protein [Escherichia coli]